MLGNVLDSIISRIPIVLKNKLKLHVVLLFLILFMFQIMIVQLCCDIIDLDIQIVCIWKNYFLIYSIIPMPSFYSVRFANCQNMQEPIVLFKGKKYLILLLSYIVISRGPLESIKLQELDGLYPWLMITLEQPSCTLWKKNLKLVLYFRNSIPWSKTSFKQKLGYSGLIMIENTLTQT